jgi:hypothetical protein
VSARVVSVLVPRQQSSTVGETVVVEVPVTEAVRLSGVLAGKVRIVLVGG